MRPEPLMYAAVGLALVALSVPARAQSSIELHLFQVNGLGEADDVEVPPGGDIVAADGYKLQVKVTRQGGTWANTTLSLEGSFANVKQYSSAASPDVVGINGGGERATWAPILGPYLPLAEGGQHAQPRFDIEDGYTSGDYVEVWFEFALDSRSTRDGVPVNVTARLEGTRDGGQVEQVDLATSQAFVGRFALKPTVYVAQSFASFTLLGEPGLRLRYEIRMYNNGGAPFRSPGGGIPSIEWAFTAPFNLHTFRIFSSVGDSVDGMNRFIDGAPATPGTDLVSLDGTAFVTPSSEAFTSDPPASAATSTKEVYQSLWVTHTTTAETVGINPYEGYSDTIVFDGFISCQDLELSNALGSRSGPDWQITVGGTVRDVVHNGTTRVAPAVTLSPQLPAELHYLVESCSERGRTHVEVWPNWQEQLLAGSGTDAMFLITFEPPMGVSTLLDAVLVNRLPSGTNVRLKSASSLSPAPFYAVPGPACQGDAECPHASQGEQCIDGQCGGQWGLRAYYCDGVAADFGSQGFLALEASGDCLPAVMNGASEWVPPSGMPNPTHVVLYSANMQARQWEDDGLGRARIMIKMMTTEDSAPIMENTAWLDGVYDLGVFSDGPRSVMTAFGVEPDGAPYTTTLDQPWLDGEAEGADANFFEDDGYYRVVDFQCAQTMAHTQSTFDLRKGECANLVYRVITRDLSPSARGVVFRIAGDPAPGDPDPGAAIALPPGVTIDGAGQAYNDAYDAVTPTYPASVPNNGISVTHNALCEPGGTVTEPAPAPPLDWRYEDGCALNWEGPTAAGTLISVGFCTDPSFPYEDGQILGFRGRIIAMGTGPVDGDLCSSGWGGADDGDAVAEPNESGNALITFRMRVDPALSGYVVPVCEDAGPAFAVTALNEGQRLFGVVTTVDVPAGATFNGIADVTPTTGVVIEVSEDGADWVALGSIAPADVRHVRLLGGPGGLELAPGAQASFVLLLATSLPAGSILQPSGEMASTAATAPLTATPFIVGSCQRLTVLKFFDDNGNQLQDPDEPSLSDWSFTVTDALGGSVGSGVTGADGTWDILLPAGSYTVHEDAVATSADYSWSLTTPQDVSVTFVVGGLGATIAFGNDCSCGTDVCQPLGCASLGGQLAACGEVQPLDCDDGNICTTDSCDPNDLDGDACVNEDVPCEDETGLFAPVTNAAGEVVGAIRCALVDGMITCDVGDDTDGDGQPNLIIYANAGGACD